MQQEVSLRPLSSITDEEKQLLFQYIFPKSKERYQVLRLFRQNPCQNDSQLVLLCFDGLMLFIFREPKKEVDFIAKHLVNTSHYLRAVFWLRNRDFEVITLKK